jgi:hypothetical protein
MDKSMDSGLDAASKSMDYPPLSGHKATACCYRLLLPNLKPIICIINCKESNFYKNNHEYKYSEAYIYKLIIYFLKSSWIIIKIKENM